MKKQKLKTKKVRNVLGQKMKISIPQRKSLKEMIEYEILESYQQDEKTNKLYEKVYKLEEQLYETINVKEKKLIKEIIDLRNEANYNHEQYVYNAVWEAIREWYK